MGFNEIFCTVVVFGCIFGCYLSGFFMDMFCFIVFPSVGDRRTSFYPSGSGRCFFFFFFNLVAVFIILSLPI